jgi:hypothetical protein
MERWGAVSEGRSRAAFFDGTCARAVRVVRQ